ncbi:MAG: hypothetical protein QME68_01280 [Elusimicrobiota bacterium]|nr:hypothetical protein [Elusimicrobiota bacterium]
MEKETFTSKNALIAKFTEIANLIKEKYGINIWFVEIFGKRWSYVAGRKEEDFFPPECIQLNEKFGIVSNNWKKIPVDKRDRLISSIKKTIVSLK